MNASSKSKSAATPYSIQQRSYAYSHPAKIAGAQIVHSPEQMNSKLERLIHVNNPLIRRKEESLKMIMRLKR